MTESSGLLVFIAAVFANNIVLSHCLGMCSFVARSDRMSTALGLGVTVTFVTTLTAVLNHLMYHRVLIPTQTEHLAFMVFIAVIAGFVQFAEMVVERVSPKLYYALGMFLPLITVNCAIFGVSLFMVVREYTFVQAFAFGAGAGLGWLVAILLLAGLRKKMQYSNIPRALQGIPAVMLVTGVMAMTFLGFAGMTN